jgi:hypothetical protein
MHKSEAIEVRGIRERRRWSGDGTLSKIEMPHACKGTEKGEEVIG